MYVLTYFSQFFNIIKIIVIYNSLSNIYCTLQAASPSCDFVIFVIINNMCKIRTGFFSKQIWVIDWDGLYQWCRHILLCLSFGRIHWVCGRMVPPIYYWSLIIFHIWVHTVYYDTRDLFLTTNLLINGKEKSDHLKLVISYKSAMDSNTFLF